MDGLIREYAPKKSYCWVSIHRKSQGHLGKPSLTVQGSWFEIRTYNMKVLGSMQEQQTGKSKPRCLNDKASERVFLHLKCRVYFGEEPSCRRLLGYQPLAKINPTYCIDRPIVGFHILADIFGDLPSTNDDRFLITTFADLGNCFPHRVIGTGQ